MPSQPGSWSLEDRLRELSADRDPLEKLQEIVDFEVFRAVLKGALGPDEQPQGGRPPLDAVLTFKMLYVQAQRGLRFDSTERLMRDRLSLQGLLAAFPAEIEADRRCDSGGGTSAAHHRRREGGDQGQQESGRYWPDKPAEAAENDTDASPSAVC